MCTLINYRYYFFYFFSFFKYLKSGKTALLFLIKFLLKFRFDKKIIFAKIK